MAKYLTFLVVILCSVTAFADSWSLPQPTETCSANKRFCLKVEPKKLTSQLDFFRDKVDEKENAGAASDVKDNFCKGTFRAKGKKIWQVKLDNEVAPVNVLVSDNGDYVVTFDNWHGLGYGDNVVAIYDGRDGRLIKKLGLTGFLTESDIEQLPHSISSIHWSGAHFIDYEKQQLVLKVVKKDGQNREFFDVRIDLSTGKVLDAVVDRLPSLRYLFEATPNSARAEKASLTEDECTGAKDAEIVARDEFQRRIIEKSLPEYPPTAKAVRVTGTSVFDVLVGENGQVRCVVPRSGHPLLRVTLMNAVKTWKFASAPTSYAGRLEIAGKTVLMLNGEIVD